jgi:hypothetical protein
VELVDERTTALPDFGLAELPVVEEDDSVPSPAS